MDRSGIIHISIDDIFDNWQYECGCSEDPFDEVEECSVGRIAPWGAHYIAIIHEDVPEDERCEIAKFIAEAPKHIQDLQIENEALHERIGDVEESFELKNEQIAGAVEDFRKIKAENKILREGMKGDYDLDRWLDWVGEAKIVLLQNEALRRALTMVYDNIGVPNSEKAIEQICAEALDEGKS